MDNLEILFYPDIAPLRDRKFMTIFHVHVNDVIMKCGIQKCCKAFSMPNSYSTFRSIIHRHLKTHNRRYDEKKIVVHLPHNGVDNIMPMDEFKQWLDGDRAVGVWDYFNKDNVELT